MEMDEIYANCEYDKSFQNSDASQNPSGSRTSEKSFHRAVVLSLVLLSVLLLAGLIGLGIYSFVLTEERDRLQADLNVITKDREQLKADLAEITKDREQLKADLDVMSGNVTRLQNLLKLREACPEGWTMSKCSCYHLSTQTGFWTRGRDDCRRKGADLVVIDSNEEQTFLSTFSKASTWIGLSDQDKEGTWTWVDGSPLTVRFWSAQQPDNGNGDPKYGEEDCVHIIEGDSSHWNDRSCKDSLPWICEKNLLSFNI